MERKGEVREEECGRGTEWSASRWECKNSEDEEWGEVVVGSDL